MTRLGKIGPVLAVAIAAVAASVIAAAPAHAADAADTAQATPTHSRMVPAQDRAAAARAAASYWTPERLRSATPLDAPSRPSMSRADQAAVPHGPPGQADPVPPKADAQSASRAAAVHPLDLTTGQQWTSGGLPSTAIGEAFFITEDGSPHSCTATSLRSDAGNAILTAGHCVIDAANGDWYNWNYQTNTWATWMFAPGYSNGYAPYGYWYAWQLWTVPDYVTTQGDGRYDIGAAVVNTNAQGYHLQDVVGSEGAQWNWPLAQYVYAFGYPQTPYGVFTGDLLIYCTGTTYADAWGRESLNCNQGHGASGGPWLARFDGSWGYADTVFSTANEPFYGGPVTMNNGAYFGDDMFTLWSNVRYL